jgi:hypothetical protein
MKAALESTSNLATNLPGVTETWTATKDTGWPAAALVECRLVQGATTSSTPLADDHRRAARTALPPELRTIARRRPSELKTRPGQEWADMGRAVNLGDTTQ